MLKESTRDTIKAKIQDGDKIMKKVQQWLCHEIEFSDKRAPHTSHCGITAQFTSPSGRQFDREAFWDGGETFRVRYALTEPGVWRYILAGAETMMEDELECIPYLGNLPIYQHGFLKVGPRGRYLCYADNTPFFWLGDTHWHFAIKERWNESNDARFKNQFQAVVDKRAEQQFTVYQCHFHCEALEAANGKDRYFKKAGDAWIPQINFFKNDLDPKMAYLAEKGFCIAAGLSWFYSALAEGAEEYYKMAARYLIARYGAYPMIWTLAGEVGGYHAGMRDYFINFWREIAKTIETFDSYQHLQTAHYTNERPFADYYQDESWFDFTMNQAGHGDYPIDSRPYQSHRALYPAKPFIESESMYENILTLEPIGRRRATPAMLRRVAYLAMQNGACGYTYGAQGLWHFQWDVPTDNTFQTGFGTFDPWYKAIDFPGADQMTLMRQFYESVSWQNLRPLSNHYFFPKTEGGLVITKNDEDLQALFMPSVLADEEMKTIVAYFSEANRFPVSFHTLRHSSYAAYWIDPAKGTKTVLDEKIYPENGVWVSPVKETEGDALLVLNAV